MVKAMVPEKVCEIIDQAIQIHGAAGISEWTPLAEMYTDVRHLRFTDCRVPKSNVLLGEGRGFEISQVRLGPGRIHHCMRSIGAAEKALELMVTRGLSREAFGKPLVQLGGNTEIISRARIEIEAMRLLVLKAAKAMDLMGNAEARVWVSAAKAAVPERVCKIIDQAIQMHGATGVSQWTPLADMYTSQRTLRLADGPDEVHHMVVGRAEIARYQKNSDDLVVDHPRN
jgi:acyl-CoA dehydrogenase